MTEHRGWSKENLMESASCANFMQKMKSLLWERGCKIPEADMDEVALEMFRYREPEISAAEARGRLDAAREIGLAASGAGLKVEHLERYEDWHAAVEFLQFHAEARGRVEGLKLARSVVEKQQRSYLPKGRENEEVNIVSAPLIVIDREIDKLFSPTRGSSNQ